MRVRTTNWAGNVHYSARRLHRPATLGELQRLVAGSGRVRAVGTGHSFNRIADTTGDLVSLAGLPPRMDIDPERRKVTVAAGLRYGDLAARLHPAGYALANLASLPHIAIAGACATGTHGSGDHLGSLATAVSAIELVTAGGDLLALSNDDPRFPGSVVTLGTLGIVTSLTLDLVPAFDISQYVYEDLPWGALDVAVFASGYSVSAFTDWTGPHINQVWRKMLPDGAEPPPEWLGARRAPAPRHPVPGLPATNCTEQLGKPGPWYARLPHFRPEFVPSSGAELQSEYLVPRSHGIEALNSVYAIRDRIAPVLQISELRTVAADELWLSPGYGRDSLALHFTWLPDQAAVAPALAALEEALDPFAVRPHWGKLFGISPQTLAGRYPRLDDFRRLRSALDPAGKFGNEFVDRYLPGDPP
jgi:xylitol oxidase